MKKKNRQTTKKKYRQTTKTIYTSFSPSDEKARSIDNDEKEE